MIVGVNAGPFLVGPINTAPISEIPCGKKDKSFSRVNTPGLTILSCHYFLRLVEIKTNNKYLVKSQKCYMILIFSCYQFLQT